MKKALILILVFSFITHYSQNKAQTPNSERKEIANAIASAEGSNVKLDRYTAFETLSKYAVQGNSRAMNALGLMYILGSVGKPDTVQAVSWLTSAGNAGFLSAWVNLGYIYKYAHGGVKQDLTKAFMYFEKAAKKGAINGCCDAGYMLYKGIGCEQNYEEAYSYFRYAALKNYSPAMYMLGLCYRNGYGVVRNEGEAQYWLAAADKLGYRFASEELEKETPENQSKPQKVKGLNGNVIPMHFRKIAHINKSDIISGTYDGVLVIYDWSGRNILKEKSLTLQLNVNADSVTGLWIENDTDTVQIFAEKKPDGLRFTKTKHLRADHYTMEAPTQYNFEKAQIQVDKDMDNLTLTGNIQMYSPETMEPERPMYISLKHITVNNNNSESKSKQFVVYPIPFSDELNISFIQTESDNDVSIGIYNTAGDCVYLYKAGKLPLGDQRIILKPTIEAGTYIIRLVSGKQSEQTIVICNGRAKL